MPFNYASTRLSSCRDGGRTGVLQMQRLGLAGSRLSLRTGLVSPPEDGAILCRFPAIYASAAVLDFLSQHRRLIYWDAAHGGAGFLLDFLRSENQGGNPRHHALHPNRSDGGAGKGSPKQRRLRILRETGKESRHLRAGLLSLSARTTANQQGPAVAFEEHLYALHLDSLIAEC